MARMNHGGDSAPASVAAAALQRNQRWLLDVVEAFGLCPFAFSCRTSGQLHREALTGLVTDARLRSALMRLQQTPDDAFEVGLILAPHASHDPRVFERQVRRVADGVDLALKVQGKSAACYAVAFHPQMPFSDQSASGLTGLWRRSPDPTVQLVRKSVLEAVRSRHTPLRYVDVAAIDDLPAWLATHPHAAKVGLSQRIAEANAQAWRDCSSDVLAAIAAARGVS